jgi:hypothetical protein
VFVCVWMFVINGVLVCRTCVINVFTVLLHSISTKYIKEKLINMRYKAGVFYVII